MDIETPSWLKDWGFELAKEAPIREVREPVMVDWARDVSQVRQMLEEGITPAMILEHPYIRLTEDAKKYLETL